MKPLTGKAMCRLLELHGWELARVNGSHHIYRKHGYPQRISVHVHGNQDLKRGLQLALLKSAGLASEMI